MRGTLDALSQAFQAPLYWHPEENASTRPMWESLFRQLQGTWRAVDHHRPVPNGPRIAVFWNGQSHAFVASIGAQADVFVELVQPDFSTWLERLLKWLVAETIDVSDVLTLADGTHLTVATPSQHITVGTRIVRRLVQLSAVEALQFSRGQDRLREPAAVVDLRRLCSKRELEEHKQRLVQRLSFATGRYEKLQRANAPTEVLNHERRQVNELTRFIATLET